MNVVTASKHHFLKCTSKYCKELKHILDVVTVSCFEYPFVTLSIYTYCRDMPEFGGPGRRHQPCM